MNESDFSTDNILSFQTAYMLTIYLRDYTSFYKDFIESANDRVKSLFNKNEWDILISALIFRHVGQLVSNGHAIVDFRENIFTTDALKLMLLKNQANGGGLHLLLKSQRVFTGIFPKISMLNHSCGDFNIRNVFEGKKLTICALKDISQHEEIYNCYGPNFKLMSFQERQDTLKLQYNFDCKCRKCLQMSDEYRFNNSILCKICNKRLFYPDKIIKIDNDDNDSMDEDDEHFFRLRCNDCQKVHENVHMKKFFSLLAQQSECNFTMNQLYDTYLSAIHGMGSLDEIRYHMTEMMLHTLITNRNTITAQNANIPLTLSIELLNVKENLYGQFGVEFLEAGFFFLDVLSILIDKEIIEKRKGNQLIEETLNKLIKSTEMCSSNIKTIIQNYISRYCYLSD